MKGVGVAKETNNTSGPETPALKHTSDSYTQTTTYEISLPVNLPQFQKYCPAQWWNQRCSMYHESSSVRWDQSDNNENDKQVNQFRYIEGIVHSETFFFSRRVKGIFK